MTEHVYHSAALQPMPRVLAVHVLIRNRATGEAFFAEGEIVVLLELAGVGTVPVPIVSASDNERGSARVPLNPPGYESPELPEPL